MFLQSLITRLETIWLQAVNFAILVLVERIHVSYQFVAVVPKESFDRCISDHSYWQKMALMHSDILILALEAKIRLIPALIMWGAIALI
jgi:hypothetical protein